MDAGKRRFGDGEEGFQIVQRRQGKQIAVEYQPAKHGSGELSLGQKQQIPPRRILQLRENSFSLCLKTYQRKSHGRVGSNVL